jgi:hypothetical protein
MANELQIRNGIKTLGLVTSSVAIFNVVMYDNTSGKIFITSSSAIGGSSTATFPFNGNAVITGSLLVSGSSNNLSGITASLFGTASYVSGSVFTSQNQALSASYAVTASYVANATTNVKSGRVSAASFGDSPFTASVSFASAFTDTNYAVSLTAEDMARTLTVQNKGANGFKINTNSSVTPIGNVYWVAVPYNN